MAKRVVLAYSGGLDTSVAVRWMIENLGVEVVCLSADVGQEGTLDGNREKALGAGAIAYEELDLRDEFARDFLAPVIKANALYENKYPLVSALSRPLIARKQVEIARKYGADGVAHGCTGKGNDQVRFEVSYMALAPDLEQLAPVRNWGFTREDSIEYAGTHDIPVGATKEKLYSIDDNLWGRAIECGEMEDPWAEPPDGVWKMTRRTATEPTEFVLSFDRGVPVAIDGAAKPLYEIVIDLNHLVGPYGWGRLDMVENRRVGIKSRETYEAPGALAILMAHADLESITVERDLRPPEDRSGAQVRRARLRRALVLAPPRCAGRVRRRVPGARDRRRPIAARTRSLLGDRPAGPALAVRLRARHLRRRGSLPSCRLRGLRAPVGTGRADVVRRAGPGIRLPVVGPGNRTPVVEPGIGSVVSEAGDPDPAGGPGPVVARTLRRRPGGGTGRVHRVVELRPTTAGRRRRVLARPCPGPGPRWSPDRRRGRGDPGRPRRGRDGVPCRRPGLPGGRRGRAHCHRTEGHRAGRTGGRQAAHGSFPQRPGRHGLPTLRPA